MFLSLLAPFVMGVITRLALRPRGQGQNNQQPLTINVPWWGLAGGWFFSVFVSLMTIPTNNFEFAIFAIALTGVAGVAIPEILRGLGKFTTSLFSKWQGWVGLIGVGIVLYALFVDSSILGGLFLLGMTLAFLGIILGWSPFKKKKGGK